MNPGRSYSIVIPTLNAGADAAILCAAIAAQTAHPDAVVVLDSQSTDGTADVFRAAGFEVQDIARDQFDHGATRTQGLHAIPPSSEFVVFLTQDALPASPDAIATLLASFDDSRVAASYGRQLPRSGASPIEAFARLHNYPAEGHQRGIEDVPRIGFGTCFFSNAFSAYRVAPLRQVGGFPKGVIFGEDTLTIAKLLRNGYRIAYAADAQAIHSHRYNLVSEFRRHFDIGAMHTRSELLAEFGKPHGKGLRYVRDEVLYLARRAPWLLPEAALRTALKLGAYRLGRSEASLPTAVKRLLSLNARFWTPSAAAVEA